MMAGKLPVFASRELYSVMDQLTKNQLIDLVVDLLRGEHGEDSPDGALLTILQQRMDVVWRYRKDRAFSLYEKYETFARIYRQRDKEKASKDELITRGAQNVKREDREGNTRYGWFMDDVWLSESPVEALNLLNGS